MKTIKKYAPAFLIDSARVIVHSIRLVIWSAWIERIKKLPVTKIQTLATDIPILCTNETHLPNDFYFHALILKRFCGLSDSLKLKCVIQHGYQFGNYKWDREINNDLPVYLCPSELRKETLLRLGVTKTIYPIGPFIAYSTRSISDAELEATRKQNGKTLVVFPSHSTHSSEVRYNTEAFCERIKELSSQFEKVRICMYWKDVLLGHHKAYEKYGFECITAGHMFDKNFMPRLKSIIESADMGISNVVGDFIPFFILLKKPFYLWKQQINIDALGKDTSGAAIYRNEMEEAQAAFNELFEAFGNFSMTITEKQYAVVDKYFGLSSVKTKEELKEILLIGQNGINKKYT
jgi:hypothetical protein